MCVENVLDKMFPGGWEFSRFIDRLEAAFEDLCPVDDIKEFLWALPVGCVIGTGNLIGVHQMAEHGTILTNTQGLYTPDYKEKKFGDWTPGRYAWEITDRKIITPIPAKGKQGLWNWDGSIT
jgi:hypothetical protein